MTAYRLKYDIIPSDSERREEGETGKRKRETTRAGEKEKLLSKPCYNRGERGGGGWEGEGKKTFIIITFKKNEGEARSTSLSKIPARKEDRLQKGGKKRESSYLLLPTRRSDRERKNEIYVSKREASGKKGEEERGLISIPLSRNREKKGATHLYLRAIK